MKTSIYKRPAVLAILGLLTVLWTVSACDEDGDLNTVVEDESLAEYMEGHPELRLYLNAVSNFREPMYICIYDIEHQSLLTPTPLGRYGSAEGIPYGEITAVEVTDAYAGLEEGATVFEVFVTDGLSPCAETWDMEGLGGAAAMTVVGMDDASTIRIVPGLLASNLGGEEWMVCGDTGDGPCVEESHLGSASTGLLPNTPLDPNNTTLTSFQVSDRFADDDQTYTICWAGSDGTMTTIGPHPSPYAPPYGWYEVDPLLSGAVTLYDGDVDCAAVDPADAITSTPIPADATFGPDGSTVKFEAGTSGTFLIIGQSVPGIPAEAGLKIIPILHWLSE